MRETELAYCVAWVVETTGEKGFQDRGVTFEEARERADRLNTHTPPFPGMRRYFPCPVDTAVRVEREATS